ncbi:PSP1-domain-containing protein [Mycena belliarum]|uniref:PSP1-domain-containing protein n=1 Tax=Mycena belliarum TaxID=1033014 RepID=A0AAD6XLX6_9AGAR|nr:PSP1-domain-containing protein [Mycena belliae]
MQAHNSTEYDVYDGGEPEDRRNRFLGGDAANNGHGSGSRAASQPPHHSHSPGFLASPPPQHRVPSSLGGSAGGGPWGGLRSASFGVGGGGRFASTFEDDELLDPEDGGYDPRNGGGGGGQYRGRSYAQDLSRSRSQSLATAPVGSGRTASSFGGGGGGAGSAAFSIPGTQRYANPDSRYGSLGALGRSPHSLSSTSQGYGSPRAQDASNMSPFVRDVGQILLDDGSFRELWERERRGGGGLAPASVHGAAHAHAHSYREHDGGGGSGTTSRRHSVSVVQPRRLAGFNAPETPTASSPDFAGGAFAPGFGGGAFASSARAGLGLGLAASSPGGGLGGGGGGGFGGGVGGIGRGGGGGGLLLSDDDLDFDFGGLNLGGPTSPSALSPTTRASHAYVAGGQGQGQGGGGGQGGAGSLPIYAPRVQPAQVQTKDWADAYFSPPQPAAPVSRIDTRPGERERAPPSPLSPRGGGGGGGGFYPYTQGPELGRQASQDLGLARQGQQGQGQGQGQDGGARPPQAELGKGLPLHAVPPDWPLYIVEFKAGRTDLFYCVKDRRTGTGFANGSGRRGGDEEDAIRVGDLVIVEADRGKDLGKVVNDSITLGEVEAFWAGQARFGSSGQSPPTSPGGPDGAGGGKKEIAPKMIYGKAGPGDAQLLVAKMQDEQKALALCQTKVRVKKLPMEVVDAEYQWDRRKLTFYFVAEKRIDFRELVRELFRLYKTRIWMASLQGANSFEQ